MRMLAASLALLAPPALAQTLEPPPPRPVMRPVAAFGADNPQCLEWTDGCVVCKRLDAATAACSTPGVACLPKETSCAKINR
ncbi:MAG TPA: hypothetical protein VEH76_03485 [Methylocystis sp.]|nr:hypothetical protein [Methylocystis sp.]